MGQPGKDPLGASRLSIPPSDRQGLTGRAADLIASFLNSGVHEGQDFELQRCKRFSNIIIGAGFLILVPWAIAEGLTSLGPNFYMALATLPILLLAFMLNRVESYYITGMTLLLAGNAISFWGAFFFEPEAGGTLAF